MSDIQDSIFSAIDTIVKNRIDSIQADKSIIATIVSCTNPLNNEYKVNYSGGYLWAYAQEGTSYTTGTSVYVLVPQGDFSQTKIILGETDVSSADSNISAVSSLLNDYNMIGTNVIDSNNISSGEIGLTSYQRATLVSLYDRNAENNLVTIDQDGFYTYVQEGEAILIEASFKTLIPLAHRRAGTGEYGLTFTLAFADQSNPDNVVTREYLLNSNNMSGNPFYYQNWTSQNLILPIDVENFLYIDSIKAYSRNFVETTDTEGVISYPNNIFISNLEIYSLKTISATNGDNKLTLSFPSGTIFKENDNATSYRQCKATFNVKETDVTQFANYEWYKADSLITTTSANYTMRGGTGWRKLETSLSTPNVLTVYKSDIFNYKNSYKCVAIYNSEIILQEEFILYNEAAQIDIEITSDLGTTFNFDLGVPTLICTISKNNQPLDANDYFFLWSKTDRYGNTTVFNATADIIEQQISALKQDSENLTYTALSSLQNKLSEVEDVNFILGNNIFTYPANKIDSYATIKCMIYTYNSTQTKKSLQSLLQQLADNNNQIQEYNEQITVLQSLTATTAINNQIKSCQSAVAELELKNSEIYSSWEELAGITSSNTNLVQCGDGSITLYNDNQAISADYTAYIVNGTQVFQYNELGISPASERYAVPLQPKDLSCIFYDPNGLEVNSSTYSYYWKIPLMNTMLTIPASGLIENPATGLYEYSTSEIYPINIADTYDYTATNNQIELIVCYKDKTYVASTDFTFTKIGNNGTNGTDIYTKIVPIAIKNTDNSVSIDETIFKTYPPTLCTYTSGKTTNTWWNNIKAATINKVGFKLKLYKNNEVITSTKTPTWIISKTEKKASSVFSAISYDSTQQAAFLTYENNIGNTSKRQTQIISSTIAEDDYTYRASLGIPIIQYVSNNSSYTIDIDKNSLLQSIVYNSAGYSPSYDVNQGVTFIIKKDSNILPRTSKTSAYNSKTGIVSTLTKEKIKIVWSAEGGPQTVTNNTITFNNPAIGLGRNSKGELVTTVASTYADFLRDADDNVVEDEMDIISENDIYSLSPSTSVVAAEFYSGEYTNNLIHAVVSVVTEKTTSSSSTINTTESKIADVYIPIYMSLNTYELESLNSWDGNSISIDEENCSILAPQIGAGKKDSQNTFTGVVMGTEQTYGDNSISEHTGLFGYASGVRSIFLNAEDGSATFGVSNSEGEQIAGAARPPQGQIKMNPGGISEIGSWKIGPDFLYNFKSVDGDSDIIPLELDNDPYVNSSSAKAVENATIFAPYNSQGIMLSSAPTYISIKGKPLSKNEGIDFDGANSALKENDFLELEIDPHKSSLFTIFRNTLDEDCVVDTNGNPTSWKRHALVGINSYGQFYTNAVEDGESSMGIGSVGAFGETAAADKYVGATFGWSETNIFKFYINKPDKDNIDKKSTELHLSAGTKTSNEYARPISVHGKNVNLYASDSSSEKETTPTKLTLSGSSTYLGYEDYSSNKSNAKLEINSLGDTTLQSYNNLNLITQERNKTISISAAGDGQDNTCSSLLLEADRVELNHTNSYALTTAAKTETISTSSTTTVGNSNGKTTISATSTGLTISNNKLNCSLKSDSISLAASNSITLSNNVDGQGLYINSSSDGSVKLVGGNSSYLQLGSSTVGNTSRFRLYAGSTYGSFEVADNINFVNTSTKGFALNGNEEIAGVLRVSGKLNEYGIYCDNNIGCNGDIIINTNHALKSWSICYLDTVSGFPWQTSWSFPNATTVSITDSQARDVWSTNTQFAAAFTNTVTSLNSLNGSISSLWTAVNNKSDKNHTHSFSLSGKTVAYGKGGGGASLTGDYQASNVIIKASYTDDGTGGTTYHSFTLTDYKGLSNKSAYNITGILTTIGGGTITVQ